MIAAKKGGAKTSAATATVDELNECEEDRGGNKISLLRDAVANQ
jgi:hypothetical protein